jgi:hypothetical protein
VDYRTETNAVILFLDIGHILRGDVYGCDREREENQKLECG